MKQRLLILVLACIGKLAIADGIAPRIVTNPNPASTVVTVQVSNTDLQNTSIKLYNVLGSEVTEIDFKETDTKGTFVLNVANLPDGIYLINVLCGKTQTTKRLKIQH